MTEDMHSELPDTGERIIPARETEVSIVFARHRCAYQYADNFVSGKTVIDIGCGTGYGCSLLAHKATRVVGIDQDANAIAYCREQYPGSNIEYREADAAALDIAETFDVATSFQVIEHLPDPSKFLVRIKRCVKPGGMILITTPNSRTGSTGVADNPFHTSEMNYIEFSEVIRQSFREFKILGVGYASKNRYREFLIRSPLYRLGRLLKRGSALKKLAAGAMRMTEFRVSEQHVAEEAIDLLALCTNS